MPGRRRRGYTRPAPRVRRRQGEVVGTRKAEAGYTRPASGLTPPRRRSGGSTCVGPRARARALRGRPGIVAAGLVLGHDVAR